MSEPADPFGSNNKTVLRLNPGGRRPAPPPAPTPPPAYQPPPPPTFEQPPPYPGQAYQPPPAYPQPAQPPAYGQSYRQPPPPGADDWYNAPPPPPPPSAQQSARALILKRDVPVAANENIILEAAGPLLLLLGRLRVSLMSANFGNLMEQVADAIDDFDKRMKQASLPPEQTETSTYAICATADDIVQHIPSEDRRLWTQYSMLSRIFGERTGGVRFFEKLDKAKQDPVTNYPVLELMYACLALGFQGIHRTSSGGAAALQMIQRNLYETLRKVRPVERNDLSPHWRGQDVPAAGATFQIPFWALLSVAAALLFAAFILLRMLLSGNTDAVTDEVRRLFADAQLAIERPSLPVAATPVQARISTQLERIRGRLTAEITDKKLDAVESGNFIVVRIGGFASFASGQATVLDTFKPIAEKIAVALESEPGDIRVVGHTDSTKIATARFASNFELSVERAKAVAELLKLKITKPDRLKVEGKADSVPIGSNETVEGRARNRRVEILIPREAVAQ